MRCANGGDQAVVEAELCVELAGCVKDTAMIQQIPAGKEQRTSFRLPTRNLRERRDANCRPWTGVSG